MAANPFLFELFDLSSVTNVVTGGAALKKHLADKLLVLRPGWKFLQAYGMFYFIPPPYLPLPPALPTTTHLISAPVIVINKTSPC